MRVLIATDGSEFSRAAVKECCRLIPDLANSKIKIVSAYEEPYVLGAEPFAVAAEYSSRWQTQQNGRLEVSPLPRQPCL